MHCGEVLIFNNDASQCNLYARYGLRGRVGRFFPMEIKYDGGFTAEICDRLKVEYLGMYLLYI